MTVTSPNLRRGLAALFLTLATGLFVMPAAAGLSGWSMIYLDPTRTYVQVFTENNDGNPSLGIPHPFVYHEADLYIDGNHHQYYYASGQGGASTYDSNLAGCGPTGDAYVLQAEHYGGGYTTSSDSETCPW